MPLSSAGATLPRDNSLLLSVVFLHSLAAQVFEPFPLFYVLI